jgi:hypothetical protein
VEEKYKALVEGNTNVENAVKVLQAILAYAQSFELYQSYQEDMGVPYDDDIGIDTADYFVKCVVDCNRIFKSYNRRQPHPGEGAQHVLMSFTT